MSTSCNDSSTKPALPIYHLLTKSPLQSRVAVATPLPVSRRSSHCVAHVFSSSSSTIGGSFHRLRQRRSGPWRIRACHAGTCTLVHRRLGYHQTSYKENSAFSMPAATDLLLKQYYLTRQEVGIPPPKKKATSPTKPAVNHNRNDKSPQKQASLHSFFAPKANNSTNNNKPSPHHPEGRFQFISFGNLEISFIPTFLTTA